LGSLVDPQQVGLLFAESRRKLLVYQTHTRGDEEVHGARVLGMTATEVQGSGSCSLVLPADGKQKRCYSIQLKYLIRVLWLSKTKPLHYE
jgi:hypothetical protein